MAGPSKTLETFPNPAPDRDYEIAFDVPEFTCLCPLTGQPDFAHFKIRYVPDGLCVELKSLKLYFWSYRNEGAFHEAVTNRIRDDLVAALAEGTTELMCHPGYPPRETRTSYGLQRAVELATLTSASARRALVEAGVTLGSFADLP